jgi:ABC-type lipoprotein release transport system permease subunit
MFFRLAWRNIWRNKRRTWITVASILLSVLLAVLMRSMQLGMYDHMIEKVVRTYAGYVQLHQKGYWDEKTLNNSMEANDSLLNRMGALEEVQVVAPRLEGFALASHQDLTKGVQVIGMDPGKERELMNLKERLEEGAIIDSTSRGVLIGKGISDYFDIGIDDTLVFLGQGFRGMSAAGKYTVKGILSLSSPELNERMVFLPMKAAQFFYGTGKRWTSLAFGIESNADAAAIAERIRSRTDSSRYEVMDWRSMMPELVQTIQADNAGGVIMVFILYMVIAFGIFGTVLMMTEERMTEFGILVAVGMKRWRLNMVVLIETVLLSMLGVVLGMALSVPFIHYFHANPLRLSGSAGKAMEEFGFDPVIPTSTDPTILLTHAGIVLAITVVTALHPVSRIARLEPVEAMRK